MEPLSNLPNIGKELEKQLQEVNVQNIDDLKALGTEATWLKIQEIDSSACIHRLYALEGAILGIKNRKLKQAEKKN